MEQRAAVKAGEGYMQKTVLWNYAKLLARTGLNVQKGQEVIISAELDQAEFVRMAAEECYRAGASKVRVEWTHQPLRRLSADFCSEQIMGEVLPWQEEKMRWEIKTLPARLYIESEDPDGFNGVDTEKYARAVQARSHILKPYRDRMENKYQWCIAAVPGKRWAKKVFSKYSAGAAEEKLWEAILAASRSLEGNPLANWQSHNAELAARCEYLNSLGLSSLEYRAPNGTHLRVGLMPGGIFMGGGETTLSGVFFNPNIPSEEVFTTPKKGNAEGIVYSTKPLSYQGQLIRNFSVRFEEGRAVEVHAAQGEAALKKMIAMDEGAAYLGECALVPFDSPISRSRILFYNTLFDENASCHLAMGRGFSNCLRGYEQLTEEEIKACGVNDSMIHVDFMIGNEELEIDGITQNGETVPLFREGGWAFPVRRE